MADPILGNKADEQGQFEQGKDFEGIGSRTLPPTPDSIEIRITESEDSVSISPVNPRRHSGHEGPEIQEGPDAITRAEVFDDPFMEKGNSPEALFQSAIVLMSKYTAAVARRLPSRDKLVYYQVSDDDEMCAFGDRIIVLQDSMQDEYACPDCKGKGYDPEIICSQCNGKKVERIVNPQNVSEHRDMNCRGCTVLGYDYERPWNSGRVRCSKCYGSGWRNGVVIPEQNQARPISGIVVSVGPEVMNLRLGDRIFHSKYAGVTTKTSQGSFTTMCETEVTGGIRKREKTHAASSNSSS